MKLEITVKRNDNLQSSEKMVNHVGKQKVQGDVEKTDFTISKTEQKRANPMCTQTNEGEPRGQHYGRRFYTFSGKPAWVSGLRCLYANT